MLLLQSFQPILDWCCELPKITVLYEHFQEHVEHDKMSVVTFLSLHYGENRPTGAHHHKDEHESQLPFGKHHQCHSTVSIAFDFKISTVLFTNQPSSPILMGETSLILPVGFYSTPFQPPRA
jgi:hypothetical protein